MRLIVRVFENILKKDNLHKPVGRWFREACDKKINRKIDLSNEDHCGPCGEYALQKRKIAPSVKAKTIVVDLE